jgi:hypothetical protein
MQANVRRLHTYGLPDEHMFAAAWIGFCGGHLRAFGLSNGHEGMLASATGEQRPPIMREETSNSVCWLAIMEVLWYFTEDVASR